MVVEIGSRYRVIERLGEGGMGEVFLAEDLRLRRPVALKVLKPAPGEGGATWTRLLKEARAASALNHPNIATIYEVDEGGGDGARLPFIAMEYVSGRTLDEVAGGKALGADEALRIVRQVADALAEAHAHGVVHRDVKPGNVMLTQSGRVKVLDFGLATRVPLVDEKATTKSPPPTNVTRSAPGLAGTMAYMSPEQALGKELDGRSDIFSLGIVLYKLLAGHLPFRGENAVALLDALIHAAPEPLARTNEAVPPALERIVRRMLEKDRERRYASMREVCAEMEALERERVRGGAMPAPPGAPPAIAVLGFANITGSGEDDWLGTGIAETVTVDLKCVPSVLVIGRERVSEVLRKLGARPGTGDEALGIELGREVGARWVVSGGYQRLGDAVRVTARVTDVDTGALLRTVKLDGPMSDIFALQDRIVRELSSALTLAEPAGREEDETHVLAAYEVFTKGVINLRAESRESLDRAILFFEKAVALDPTYARAWLYLGNALEVKATVLSVPELLDRALSNYRRALELRPNLAEAWREMGAALVHLGRQTEAFEAIRKALALDPSDAAAHGAYGRACFIGLARFDEAAAAYERALALNPQAGWYALQLAHAAALLRDFPRGESAARRAVALQEDFLSGHEGAPILGAYVRLAQLYALQDRHTEAIAELEKELGFLGRIDHALKERAVIEIHTRLGSSRLRLGDTERGRRDLEMALRSFERRVGLGADDPFTRYYAAMAYALSGERERALDCLEKAAAVRRRFTVERARIEPDFESLRSEPRFCALLDSRA